MVNMKKHISEEDIEFNKIISIHFKSIIAIVAAVILAEQIIIHIGDIHKAWLMITNLFMR